MDVTKQYAIAWKGLKNGTYRFDFKVDNALFEAYGSTDIKDGDLSVGVTLERGESMLSLQTVIRGTVTVACDRCLELVRGQIDSLRTRRLSTRRLALAKKQFVAQLAISMESNEGYMLGAGKSYLVHSEVDTMEEVYRKISDLQAGELLEVANEVLASPSLLVYR